MLAFGLNNNLLKFIGFMTHFLRLLPNELFITISNYFDSTTKRRLSMIDRRTHEIVLDTVRSIRVSPPRLFSPHGYAEDILVKVIRRYPKLEKIIFGLTKNWTGSGEFVAKQERYLRSLISYLESNAKKHPLNSVKKIQFSELTHNNFATFNKKKAKELNSLFLRSIGHPGLEHITISPFHTASVLTGNEIQPVLENSPNLKTFVFDGFESNQTITLSFANQPLLSKVKLLNWKGAVSTIESLKSCKNLEKLVIDYTASPSDEIKAILLGDHPWNLKDLVLKEVAALNDTELDAMTKKLPNLESLSIELNGISDDGMERLGRNCPNLKVVQFSNEALTNFGLDRLTQHLPHLKVISFDTAYNITGEGIAAIGRNCKHLRCIQVVHYDTIEKSGMDALIANCQNLKVVEFSHGGPVSLEGMHALIEQIPNLRYIQLEEINGIQENQIKRFYRKFPQISKIPYHLNVLKLPDLIR